MKFGFPKIRLSKNTFSEKIKWPKETNFYMENIFSNMGLLKMIIKWRLHLIIIVAIAIALSVLFSCPWFIKPKYKSSAVLYPSNLVPYSNETPTELMLQLFKSDDIRDTIIKRFNLASHYDIDVSSRYYYARLIKEFESNVDIRKTEYESVIIEIFDTDPQSACNMVKEMVNLFNKKARTLQREKEKEVLKISKDQLNQKQIQIDTLKRRIDELRTTYGLLDYTVQTREASRAFFGTRSEGYSPNANVKTAGKIIENLQNKGGDFILLSSLYFAASDAYNKLKENYENALKDVTKELTYTNYVSSPVPSDKKVYPVRWLIVLITTVATFIFALIIIMLLENSRRNEKVSDTSGA